jgi:hypothetical protein
MAAKKQKRRKMPGFQFSISLDVETTQELMMWMHEKGVDRSEAVRYLLRQGLYYEKIIIPENLRRAKEQAERERQQIEGPGETENPERNTPA